MLFSISHLPILTSPMLFSRCVFTWMLPTLCICLQWNTSCVTFNAPCIMVCKSIILPSRNSFPTQMVIEVDVLTLVDLLRVIVFFLGQQNFMVFKPQPTQRLQNHVGSATFSWNFIFLFLRLLLYIVIMLVLSTYPIILSNISS